MQIYKYTTNHAAMTTSPLTFLRTHKGEMSIQKPNTGAENALVWLV